MRSFTCVVLFTLFLLIAVSPAQQASTTAVPNLITYSGTLVPPSDFGASAKVVGVTFAVYRQENGGAPIWLETQNVTLDSADHYSVLLGSTKAEGIPADLFSTQEQRWLGVQMQGQAEQPRVLLVSVPYAMKAADAETLGGRPATDYVLSAGDGGSSWAASAKTSAFGTDASSQNAVPALGAISGGGTKNFVPIWISPTKLGNSTIFETGGKIGIGTINPTGPLDVVGVSDVLQVTATASAARTFAVAGQVSSTTAQSSGVFGLSRAASGITFGVFGAADGHDGAGVLGLQEHGSTESTAIVPPRAGVWGDTGGMNGRGVAGTADNGIGIVALNNSPSSGFETLGARNDSADPSARVFETEGLQFGGKCIIDVSGNLTCDGTKSAAVPLTDGRKVALYAVEAPENWFEDAGSGKLTNGIATVSLDPTFAQTVNTAIEYHVFLTPKGECEGLYVANQTPQGFDVRELRGGHSDVIFDYRIMARRKGYEKIRLTDVTEQVRQSVLDRSAPRP